MALTGAEKGRLTRYRNMVKKNPSSLSVKQTQDLNRLIKKERQSRSGNSRQDTARRGRASGRKRTNAKTSATKKKKSKREIAEAALGRVLGRYKRGQASIAEVDAVIKTVICAMGQASIKSMCGKSGYKYEILKSRNRKRKK
jgi:hypothetical protein